MGRRSGFGSSPGQSCNISGVKLLLQFVGFVCENGVFESLQFLAA